ncbi:MAG: class I SAM-dependent methyltransferase [Anaerolineae bacterium]
MAYEFVDYSESLLRNFFMLPAVETAIAAMNLPAGAHVLDAGCGAGAHFPLFAKLVNDVHIVGVDLTPGHIEAARHQVNRWGLQKYVEVLELDLRGSLPFAYASFDGIWVANVISPKTFARPSEFVQRLSRLLRPGGILAIYEGYGVRPLFLPGYPRLEHLIGVARCLTRHAPDEDWAPDQHPENSRGWLLAAKLESVRLDVHTIKYEAPLPDEVFGYVVNEVLGGYYAEAVRTGGEMAGMTVQDIELWERISNPASPHCIASQPGYYCIATAITAYGYAPG